MTARAAFGLHLPTDDGVVVYDRGDEIKAEHLDLISNPAAIEDDGEVSDVVVDLGEQYPLQQEDGTLLLGPDVVMHLVEGADGDPQPRITYQGVEFAMVTKTDETEAPGDAEAVEVSTADDDAPGSASEVEDTTEDAEAGAGTPVEDDSDAKAAAAKPRGRARGNREG